MNIWRIHLFLIVTQFPTVNSKISKFWDKVKLKVMASWKNIKKKCTAECCCPLKCFSQSGRVVTFDYSCPQAVDKNGIKLPHTVEVIMNRWILQMGFPVVTIDTKTGRITQKHFLLDPESVVETPSEFK